MSDEWRKINIVCRYDGEGAVIEHQPMQPMRPDLLELFDIEELKKYLTAEELPTHDAGSDH